MRAETAPHSSHEELRQEPSPASAGTAAPSFDVGDERVALRLADGCGETWACCENGDSVLRFDASVAARCPGSKAATA